MCTYWPILLSAVFITGWICIVISLYVELFRVVFLRIHIVLFNLNPISCRFISFFFTWPFPFHNRSEFLHIWLRQAKLWRNLKLSHSGFLFTTESGEANTNISQSHVLFWFLFLLGLFIDCLSAFLICFLYVFLFSDHFYRNDMIACSNITVTKKKTS